MEIGIRADPSRDAAFRSAGRMAVFTACASIALAIAFLMTARIARAQTKLAELRSDFVSTVTHNLKTPIASIRILSEALTRSRATHSTADVAEYGLMLVQETRQLSRLVDNLLAYSRVSDVGGAYSFEPLPLDSLVEKALSEFRQRLLIDGFIVHVNIADDVPDLKGDARAIGLVLVNVIDNAIRYSSERKLLTITAAQTQNGVSLTIADAGDGIPDDELPRIGRIRGRHARCDGSGLGLALSRQIIQEHGGGWQMTSSVGQGTCVKIDLPIA
jgi:two-component system phosphate regulon sensor histidine kinase PhoR